MARRPPFNCGCGELVDLLAKPSQGAEAKKTGFQREFFPDFEREKGERAEAKGIVVEGVKVWEPSDPRWKLQPPYHFISMTLLYGGYCVYCATKIEKGKRGLFSRKIQSVAHEECHADYDRVVPRVANIDRQQEPTDDVRAGDEAL